MARSHVLAGDQRVAGLAGPVVGLADDVGHVGEAGGQLALVLHQPAGVLHHLGHAGQVEGAQALLLAAGADEAGDLDRVLVVPVHLAGKVGPHLEQLLELVVVGVEQVVGVRVADQDDLDVQRDRLRAEAGGGDHAELLAQLLDLDLLGGAASV